jgi:kumamolisin
VKTRQKIVRPLVLALALTSAFARQANAEVRAQGPAAAAARAMDMGELTAQPDREPISVTIALALPNLAEAEDLLQEISSPASAQFHQFLSADEFVARFAPSGASVAGVVEDLAHYGLRSERIGATMLKVTGSAEDIERTFAVNLHRYAVPAHDDVAGFTFHAPRAAGRLPPELAGKVAGVVGLDSRPRMRPHLFAAPEQFTRPEQAKVLGAAGNPMGSLTVADFASQYDVRPLYNQGVLGTGKTIGILTFASFSPADAFAYWSAVGLAVNQNRLTVINVDGGAGAPSDAGGSEETTLDVEQSGGVAPQANIMVYQAPNTSQGFVDLVANAVEDNLADSLSISWGEWEWFDNLANSPVSDPSSGSTVGVTQAVHELLVRAAIQGQSVYTSAGDNGAYEANGDLNCYGPYSSAVPKSCSLTLSVDYPASDPAITAAGGTTLPGLQRYCVDEACTQTYSVNIAHEQVWGWAYLAGLCAAKGTPDLVACGTYGVGSGGGVSVIFAVPFYQAGVRGVLPSQPRQVFRAGEFFVDNDDIPALYAMPAHFSGRNVPDISFNADPDTGYSVYYTSSKPGSTRSISTFVGGTSFVAPQLNGVAALLGQYLGGQRIGLVNSSLYSLAGSAPRRRTPGSVAMPLHAVLYGNNWSFAARNGYSPAAGLGTLDVAQFAQFLGAMF